jgi:lysophospholipase L1-like esterase
VLSEYEFAVVHFNNGLHGEKYDDTAYAAGLAQAFDDLLAHPSIGKLIWASTTPFRDTSHPEGVEVKNDRVLRRNRIAASLAAERSLPVSDLFTTIANNLDYIGPDGVHLAEAGQLACAEVAVNAITEVAERTDHR